MLTGNYISDAKPAIDASALARISSALGALRNELGLAQQRLQQMLDRANGPRPDKEKPPSPRPIRGGFVGELEDHADDLQSRSNEIGALLGQLENVI